MESAANPENSYKRFLRVVITAESESLAELCDFIHVTGSSRSHTHKVHSVITMEDNGTSVEPRLLVDEASILPSLVLGAAGAVGGMASLALTYVPSRV